MQSTNNPSTDFSIIKNFFNSAQLIEGAKTHWRTRAKLAVRGTSEHPLIGLFKEGTHEIVDLPGCPDHHPSIDKALSIVREALPQFQIQPYDEKSLQGHLRYMQFVVERLSGLVQLTLVANGSKGHQALLPLIEHLKQKPIWHSIWINIQEGSTNTIFGKKWIHLFGKEEFWEELCKTALCLHPGCFFQANPSLFEEIVEEILKQMLPGKKVVELYAGVGTIGLIVAPKSHSVTLVESNPLCLPCFKKSAALLPKQNVEYHQGDAKTLASLLEGHEVLIVDPPRKGIDAALMQNILSTTTLEQIIYVSCCAETFLRDAQKLITTGWKIAFARCYALFPGTSHVETLAIFEKESG